MSTSTQGEKERVGLWERCSSDPFRFRCLHLPRFTNVANRWPFLRSGEWVSFLKYAKRVSTEPRQSSGNSSPIIPNAG